MAKKQKIRKRDLPAIVTDEHGYDQLVSYDRLDSQYLVLYCDGSFSTYKNKKALMIDIGEIVEIKPFNGSLF